jgi:hypothetical protein
MQLQPVETIYLLLRRLELLRRLLLLLLLHFPVQSNLRFKM